MYHDHIIWDITTQGIDRRDGIVTEIIDYYDSIYVIMINGGYVYNKPSDVLYHLPREYFMIYDRYYYSLLADHPMRLNTFFRSNWSHYAHEKSIGPLANFVRFLRKKHNEEYDPKKVDHGTVVYKRKPRPMIKRSNILSDIMILNFCSGISPKIDY